MVAHNHETKEELEDIEHNLEGLTMGIPDVQIDDLLNQYQWNTTGVYRHIAHLLSEGISGSSVLS
jgi:hypothetical protein